MSKKILFLDMDNVIVDFMSGVAKLDQKVLDAHKKIHGESNLDEIDGVFGLMEPLPGAIESVLELSEIFDTYILSSSPWLNPSAWSDKLSWVHTYFGQEPGTPMYKRVILSHNKHLARGDFLVDDRPNNGADAFANHGGEWIHFGKPGLEDWSRVAKYLRARA